MPESRQHTLDRVRKPRVHITYDVETNGALEVKELPFVVGVLADLVGNPTDPGKIKPLDERKFVTIDRDNFNEVMARMEPELNFRVENTLRGDGSEMSVELKFRSVEDFEPKRIVDQVEPLKKLLEARNKLRDLLTTVDKSAKLETELENILTDTDKLQRLQGEVGTPNESGDGDKNSKQGDN